MFVDDEESSRPESPSEPGTVEARCGTDDEAHL